MSTVRMFCVREAIANQQLPVEAQKLLEVYDDPDVSPEQKRAVKAALDKAIEALEAKVTTRRLNEASA